MLKPICLQVQILCDFGLRQLLAILMNVGISWAALMVKIMVILPGGQN